MTLYRDLYFVAYAATDVVNHSQPFLQVFIAQMMPQDACGL
jgi:hypothetical protein